MPMIWDDKAVEALTAMIAKGLSYSRIGARLGCSRNACLGKAHRLKIALPRTSTFNRTKKSSPKKRRRDPTPVPPPPSSRLRKLLAEARPPADPYVEPPMDTPVPGGKVMADLETEDCRWPHGDPRHEHFRFCARPRAEGLSYCATHACVAYRVVEASRKPAGGHFVLTAIGVAPKISEQAQRRPEPQETVSDKETVG